MGQSLEDLAATLSVPEDEEKIASPARSNAGNLRNVKQMSDTKLSALAAEMEPFADADPIGFDRVSGEMQSRGL